MIMLATANKVPHVMKENSISLPVITSSLLPHKLCSSKSHVFISPFLAY